MIVVGVITFLARFGLNGFELAEDNDIYGYIAVLIVFFGYIAYIIVHELTHGVCYKALTKQKLRFGLTLTVAYCGLREGYVNKKTALISVLAPFVVHSIWLIPVIFLIPNNMIAAAFIVLFALHFGGCCGDLWVTFILLFRYRKQQVLMCDNGPKQQFFIYDENAPEYPEDNSQS